MASNQYDAQASTNYKEAFSLFDKRGNGRVALESLGDLLRACGQNPTLAEIRELEKNVGGDCEFISPAYAGFRIEGLYARRPAADAMRYQSTSRPSSAFSTGRAASATPASQRSIVAASRCSTRT